jgi:hypothetical protein
MYGDGRGWSILGGTIVAMMQSAAPFATDDTTAGQGRLPMVRRFLPEPEMHAVFVIVADIFRKQPLQMTFAFAAMT